MKHFIAMAALSASPGFAADITNVCYGNAWESCYIFINGEIDADTPKFFKESRDRMEGGAVLLNSEGGDLEAAVTLGRLIRESGLSTAVGFFEVGEGGSYPNLPPSGGVCNDACVLALAGGKQRFVAPYNAVSLDWPSSFSLSGESGIASAVNASAYLGDMGINPKLLLHSNGQLSPQDMETFGVVHQVERAFSPLVMEPYQGGLIVASRRIDEPNIYDRLTQLTIYCRDDEDIRLLLTADGGFAPEDGRASVKVRVGDARGDVELDVADYRIWTTDDRAFVELSVDKDAMPDALALSNLEVQFFMGRASGGTLWAAIELNQMDRQMLNATLGNCLN